MEDGTKRMEQQLRIMKCVEMGVAIDSTFECEFVL